MEEQVRDGDTNFRAGNRVAKFGVKNFGHIFPCHFRGGKSWKACRSHR